MPPCRRRPAVRLAVLALVTGVLAAACAGSGYHYVKNSDDGNFFKVPDEWELFGEDRLLESLDLTPRQEEIERETAWRVGFDASPRPALRHLEQPLAKHPVGQAFVVELDQGSSDTISTEGLRNLFFDIDTALEQTAGDPIFYDTIELDGGFRGIHLVAEIDEPESGRAIVFNQKVVVDQSTSTLYALVISCAAACYEANEDEIDQIVDSWTVRD